MSAPYPFNLIPPYPEARGDRPPPRFSDDRLPFNFEIPPWNNGNIGLYDNELGCRLLPVWPGIGFNGGGFPGSLNVDCRTGISTEMKVCRQFQRRGKCAYGDQCRFLHEVTEKTRDFGSCLNYEGRTVVSGHVMDRRSGVDQLKEFRSNVQTNVIVRSEIPKPTSCKTRPCFPWQTTGHCPYGDDCRFAHGESEIQELETCSASERGSVAGASETTAAGLMGSKEIGIDCKNTESKLNQFCKSKDIKKLIGIYADWLDS